MKFCPNCRNYLVMKLANTIDNTQHDTHKLIAYDCLNCGYKTSLSADDSKCVYQSQTDISKIKIHSQNLRYLKFDPTLPHIDNISCPNDQCTTKDGTLGNNILYMTLNDEKQIYLYQCCHCNYTWTNK